MTSVIQVLFLIREAVFAVAFSIRVISSAPRRSRGSEPMTSFESATANTASRIRNGFSYLLNIHCVEGIGLFVILWKKKQSICKHENIWVDACIILLICTCVSWQNGLEKRWLLQKNTKCSPKDHAIQTQWRLRIFECWKEKRHTGDWATESNDFGLDVSVVGSLKTETLTMTAETLNFWLCKFLQEVRGGDGNKYPEKTLYQLICCIKRYYEENGRAEIRASDTAFTKLLLRRLQERTAVLRWPIIDIIVCSSKVPIWNSLVAQITFPKWFVKRLPSMFILASVHAHQFQILRQNITSNRLLTVAPCFEVAFDKIFHCLECISSILWTMLRRIDGWMAEHILFDSFYVNFPLLKPPLDVFTEFYVIFVVAKLVLFSHKADVFIHVPKTKYFTIVKIHRIA